MKTASGPGTPGLKMDEPLLWEKGKKGRNGFSLPKREMDPFPLDASLVRESLDFPDLGELDVVRHYSRLSQWNFGVDTGLYPLGSCTMKYNPKTNERQAALPPFGSAHPLFPSHQTQGILRLIADLETFLAEITGMDGVSLQPAAGAQGELCGMLLFKAYHAAKGEKRTKIIVPDTAHGTNPASAALCGLKPVVVSSDTRGILSRKAVAEIMDSETAGMMITNPNTLGLFESEIAEITDIVHQKGGLVYGDGANMNAIMGVVKPGAIGVDVLHLNLHKTFATPHGGGGPGAGPVCVKAHLKPFLPVPRILMKRGKYIISDAFPQSIGRLHSFYGNIGVMLKAYAYILSMGAENLKKVSQLAVLNANYIKACLMATFDLPYDAPCMHECVFSDKKQRPYKLTTLDIAKRLMDYGYHPPTIYFPLVVSGALMIEPTETESKEDLDGFIEAMQTIAREAASSPELLLEAPRHTRVRRLNETAAARKPCLTG